MRKWHASNMVEMVNEYPALIAGYRGDAPQNLPGAESDDAYYEHRVRWLSDTLHKLDTGDM
jgi:hypothetical protein